MIADWIGRYNLFAGRKCILLAVSGGADSMAMLHALLRLREQGVVQAEWVVGHVNHRLRGAAADADQRFVEQYAAERGLKILARSVDVSAFAREQKLSIETAGRILRIQTLAEMARRCGAGAVATAHHRDDLAETMIFRLRRGTGFRGLQGIRPISRLEGVVFVRPMLGITRKEIVAYCRREHLPWQEDPTNADCGFTRNWIRYRLIPYLQEQTQTDLVERTAALAQQAQHLFERIDAKIADRTAEMELHRTPGEIVLSRTALVACSPVVLAEILRRCLVQLAAGLRDYTARHYQQIMHCVYGSGCMKCSLPGNIECRVDKQTLTLQTMVDPENPLPEKPVRLEIGTACQFGPFEISALRLDRRRVSVECFKAEKDRWTEWLDADKIKGPIQIRRRRPGDRFCPLGMKTEKKVGKFLTAEKTDPKIKKNVLVFEDAEKILWVAPVRIHERVKINEQTRFVLQLSVKQ